MIQETFYVYKDNKTGKYLQYVFESGADTHLYLVDDFREGTRVPNIIENKIQHCLDWMDNVGNKMKVYVSYSDRVKNEPFIIDQSKMELMVEKYCIQTIFLNSRLLSPKG